MVRLEIAALAWFAFSHRTTACEGANLSASEITFVSRRIIPEARYEREQPGDRHKPVSKGLGIVRRFGLFPRQPVEGFAQIRLETFAPPFGALAQQFLGRFIDLPDQDVGHQGILQ